MKSQKHHARRHKNRKLHDEIPSVITQLLRQCLSQAEISGLLYHQDGIWFGHQIIACLNSKKFFTLGLFPLHLGVVIGQHLVRLVPWDLVRTFMFLFFR